MPEPSQYALGYSPTRPVPFYDRYTNAALRVPAVQTNGQPNIGAMYGNRLLEEFGIRDIWEELARLDDDGMSVTGFLKNAFGIGERGEGHEGEVGDRRSVLGAGLWQTVTQPLQLTFGMAVEANRLAAVPVLSAYDALMGQTGWNQSAGSPWRNYLSGGQTLEENASAPGVYKSLTLSDLNVVMYDMLVHAGVPRPLATLMSPQRVIVGGNDAGPLENGAYLPWAWDLTAPDAADQMDRAGIYQSQRVVSEMATLMVIDPLNYLAAPIMGARAAWKGYTLISDSQKALEAMGPAAYRSNMIARSTGSGSQLTAAMEIDKVQRRLWHRPAGMGLWNQARMLDMLQGSKYSPVIQHIAATSDVDELARLFSAPVKGRRVVADTDEAYALAKIASRLGSTEEVLHLFNAAAYRNVHSVAVIDDVLADTNTLRNDFRTLLGLQDDIFERAALDFVGEGGPVPKGHILTDSAPQFIDEVLDEQPLAREAWDALGQTERDAFLGQVRGQQEAMHAMQRIFGDQGPQVLGGRHTGGDVRVDASGVLLRGEDAGSTKGMGTIEFIPRDVDRWLKPPRVYRVEGSRAARFRPTILFMNKPGVHFALHGDDAIDKFNDLIRWVDARITSVERVGVTLQGPVKQMRFTPEHDDELRVLRDEFINAGALADAPEHLRSKIMDRFQTLVLTRMAESAGFEVEVAEMIAARGMDRGRNLVDKLTDAERGYISVVMEDGRPLFLRSQPTVERQAANYVGLMDWDAAYKALVAVRKGEHALIHGESDLISAATAEKYFSTDVSVSKYANKRLQYVGREERIVGRAGHMVLDLAEAVNHIFKISVLLRLGYTARNLTEGTASVMASGMSMVDLARHSDLAGLVGNSLWNAAHIPYRQVDRLLTKVGGRYNDQAIIQVAEAHGVVGTMQQDELHRVVAVLANAERETVAAMQSGNLTAEEYAQAAKDLLFVQEQRQRLALGITADNTTQAGGITPLSSLDAAQHLYHADTAGGLRPGAAIDPQGAVGIGQRLTGPIRMTEDPALAAGHVDQQWGPIAARGWTPAQRRAAFATQARMAGGGGRFRYTDRRGVQRETTSRGEVLREADPTAPVTVHRVVGGVVQPGNRVQVPPPSVGALRRGVPLATRVAEFRAQVQALNAGDIIRFTDTKGQARETTNLERVVKRADPTHPITVHAMGPNTVTPGTTTVGLAPDWQNRMNQIGADLDHTVTTAGADLTKEAPDWRSLFAPGIGAKPTLTEAEIRAGLKSLEDYHARITQTPTIGKAASMEIALEVAITDLRNMLATTIANPGRITPGVLSQGVAVSLPHPVIPGVTRKTHHLQMRDNPNSDWRPFDNRALTPTTEVRALSRATHPDGFPKVMSLDTWGRQADLREPRGQAAVLQQFNDIDQPLIDAAVAGDHAAQDRLSNVLAGHGIHRMVLPDSVQWGRRQIIVHPDGVGEAGFRRAVNAEHERAIDAMARVRPFEEDAAEMGVRGRSGRVRRIEGLSRKQVRGLNRSLPERTPDKPWRRSLEELHDMVGMPMTPTQPLKTIDVLRNGGLENVINELVEAAITTRRNQYVTKALYDQRARHVAGKLAKRTGIRGKANRIHLTGAYGEVERVLPSLLAGADGAMFGSLASGKASYMLGYTQVGYLTELLHDMEKGFLAPTMITPEDPRYFDALANLFGRQFRDEPGRAAGVATGADLDNLDPVVRRLLAPGDRQRLIEEATDWALHTEQGRQWVRTLGLKVAPNRSLDAEWVAAERAADHYPSSPRRLSRMQRRYPVEADWPKTIAVGEVTVGDAIATMSNFLENYVLHSPRATELLLKGGATGDALRAAHLAEPWELRPVHGLLSPTTAESRALLERQRAGMSNMERFNHAIVQRMSHALNTLGAKPETRLLRHPVFEMVGQADLRQRISFAESTLGRNLNLDEINALRKKSQRFALKRMEQTLYTLSGRNQVDDWARFVMPFFPAWRNAITRWGRMASNTPGHVALLADRVNAVGHQLTIVNESGEEIGFNEAGMKDSYVVLPGFGGMLERLTGMPGVKEAMRNTYIPLRSMDVIFQGDMLSPGFSPWVAMPLQELLTGHSEWVDNVAGRWINSKVFPVGPTDTGNRALDDAFLFMPTAMRRMVEWAIKDESWAGEMDRNLRLLIALQRTGQMEPTSDVVLHQQAQQLTHLKMSVKLMSSLASPVAQQQRGDVEYYATQWRQLRDMYGSTDLADEAFNKLFPPEMLLLTTQSSKNLTGGAATSRAAANQRGQADLQRLAQSLGATDTLGFFENYDDEAFLTGAESEGYTQQDYNPFARRQQRLSAPAGSDDPFRERLTPEQSLRNAKVKDGYRIYDQTRATIERELVQRGMAPGSWGYQKELDDRMATVADLIGADIPEWQDEHLKRDEGRLLRNERMFNAAINDPTYGFITEERSGHALIQSIQRFLQVRASIQNEIYQRAMAGGGSNTTDSVANYDLALLLAHERATLSTQSPAFRQWADRYFRNDAVSIDDAYVTQRGAA